MKILPFNKSTDSSRSRISLQPRKRVRPKVIRRWFRNLGDDRGVVESALVMIPTLFLFLGSLQLISTVFSKAIATNMVQGQVSRVALLDSQEPTTGLAVDRTPLAGGGFLIAGERKQLVPQLSPLLVGHNEITSIGIAVDENSQ